MTLGPLRHEHHRHLQRAGKGGESETLAELLGWIERWETVSAGVPVPRMGVATERSEGNWIASMGCSIWKDLGVEGRCRAWEERLLGCTGARLEAEPQAPAFDG